MGFLNIIPEQVFHQKPVKDVCIVHLIGMPISELLLYGAVETLQVAVRLGMAGIVEVMYQILFTAGQGKVLLEFVAVIGLHPGYLERSNTPEFHKEVAGVG